MSERFYIINHTNNKIIIKDVKIEDVFELKEKYEKQFPTKEFHIFNMERICKQQGVFK